MGQSDKPRRRRRESSFSHTLELAEGANVANEGAIWTWDLSCAEATVGWDGATSGG